MIKYVIACINNDIEILDTLYNKISKIVSSDYIIETYINAEQALIGCFNNIISGNELLITITGNNFSSMSSKDFLLDLYKNSPNTKNIIFENSIPLNELEEIINKSSVYKIISNQLKKVDFELIIFEAIKLSALDRRLKEYQRVLEDAVDKKTKELNNINIKLNILGAVDSLCGVKNRRSFFELCGPIISYSRREKKELAVLMIDIDKFKLINDTYGHAIGDEILKLMAQKTGHILRNNDIFARLGGEKFAAVLPGTSQRGALKVAENIRKEIENLEYITLQDKRVKFTISIGLAMLSSQDIDLEAILHRADLALYEAKKTGRNKICSSNLY